MKKSKKSMLFQPLLVLFTIVVLTFAFFRLETHYNELAGMNKYIGSRQVEIVRTYQKTENTLFYIDQSAKLSADQAIYELAQNGGFHTTQDYEKAFGYFLWFAKDKEYYPNYKLNFDILLNENLDNYFNLYKDTKLPKNNYESTFYNNQLIGNALENINIPIRDKKYALNKVVGNYSVKPSFNINFNHDITQYKEIITNVKKLNNSCNNPTNPNKLDCINSFLANNNFNWITQQNGNVFLFDIPTNKKAIVYDGSTLKRGDVVIKFGVEFT